VLKPVAGPSPADVASLGDTREIHAHAAKSPFAAWFGSGGGNAFASGLPAASVHLGSRQRLEEKDIHQLKATRS
jgi:hypothetical protein